MILYGNSYTPFPIKLQVPVFPVAKNLTAKLLIFQGRLWHENVLIGEFGALSEDFRAAKQRILGDFRVSDVPVPAASGSMVKNGTARGFQAASGVTRLRILSGLIFSMQPKAIASMTAKPPAMRRCMADLPRRKWSSS